jgi:hypothetical protein
MGASPSSLRISAKNLGAMAMPDFCPRCFWLGLHYDLPFGGPFPGIFSSLDSYSKKVVHAHFDRFNRAPEWLSSLGEFTSYIPPPTARTFFIDDPDTGIRLTGAPDAIFVRPDDSKAIIDYKTAKHTSGQDALLPIYEVQLNGYAMIADQLGMGPVKELALVYTEPVTDGDANFLDQARTEHGFRMDFHAKVVPVTLDPSGRVRPLLREARRIFDREAPPKGAKRCDDCENFETLVSASQSWH